MHKDKVHWYTWQRQESKVKPRLIDNKVVLVPTTCEIIYSGTYGILIE